MKPRIDRTAFGSITIEGCGTSHTISLAEAEHVFEPGAEQLIIGAGQSGLFHVTC